MALLKYFSRERYDKNDEEVVHLSIDAESSKAVRKRGDTNSYNEHERSKIGHYASENGNKKVQQMFKDTSRRKIPESTVPNFKKHYQDKIRASRVSEAASIGHEHEATGSTSKVAVFNKLLPKRKIKRKSLLGEQWDAMISAHVNKHSLSGAAINSSLVLAVAQCIVKGLVSSDSLRLFQLTQFVSHSILTCTG